MPLKFRGYLTVTLVGLVLILLDVIQRTVVAGLVNVLPTRRHAILGAWQRWIARLMIGLTRVAGGAEVGSLPSIPGHSGVLVLMNHQSLLDIPIMVASFDDLYPRIVTRARYSRGKPLISHMLRLYQYPLVDPGATVRGGLDHLERAVATSDVPIGLFPEGTRTRDGEIGRFKRLGIGKILRARRWEVYLLVADGLWRAATLEDFLTSVSAIEARTRLVGPFLSPDPGLSDSGRGIDLFVEEMRDRMVAALEEMRGGAEPRPGGGQA